MKRHYYQFMYQLKIPSGYATGEAQLNFAMKIRPNDIDAAKCLIKDLNKNIDASSVVITGLFYFGEFDKDESTGGGDD